MSFRRSIIRVFWCALALCAVAVVPAAFLNATLVAHVASSVVVARSGTDARDLHAFGAALASRVSSAASTRLWAESATRVGGVPLSTLSLAASGAVTVLVLSTVFGCKATDAVPGTGTTPCVPPGTTPTWVCRNGAQGSCTCYRDPVIPGPGMPTTTPMREVCTHTPAGCSPAGSCIGGGYSPGAPPAWCPGTCETQYWY